MVKPNPRVSRSRGRAVVDRPALAAGELAGGEVTIRGSPRRGGPDAPRTGTGEARKEARWRAWWVGGVARRRYADSGHGRARGDAHELRDGKAVLMRAKRRREVERRWAVRAEPSSGEEELTPARNYWSEKTYHGEQTQAPVAKGGGDAAGEMEMAPTHWSGRNGQLRRWRSAEASAAAAAGAGGDERAKWRSEGERSAVRQMKARQEGAGQAGAAARRARRRMASTRRARSVAAG